MRSLSCRAILLLILGRFISLIFELFIVGVDIVGSQERLHRPGWDPLLRGTPPPPKPTRVARRRLTDASGWPGRFVEFNVWSFYRRSLDEFVRRNARGVFSASLSCEVSFEPDRPGNAHHIITPSLKSSEVVHYLVLSYLFTHSHMRNPNTSSDHQRAANAGVYAPGRK